MNKFQLLVFISLFIILATGFAFADTGGDTAIYCANLLNETSCNSAGAEICSWNAINSSCVAKAVCTDSDNGIDYYKKGAVPMDCGTAGVLCGIDSDYCKEDGKTLVEYSCGGNFSLTTEFVCPNGCSEGACKTANSSVEPACTEYYWFDNSNKVCGYKQFCGAYMYFGLQTFNTKDECETALSENATITCQPTKCDDGTMSKCSFVETGECICSTCTSIILQPVCGNGICESGEGQACACAAIACAEGKECKPNCKCEVQCEQDCRGVEPITININEKFKLGIYESAIVLGSGNKVAKLRFKDLIAYKCKISPVDVQVAAVIKEKLATTATLTGKAVAGGSGEAAVSSSSGGSGGGGSVSSNAGGAGKGVKIIAEDNISEVIKCIGSGPKALLDLEILSENGRIKNNIINLDLNEQKQIGEFAVSFLSYDYASRTGTFLVQRILSTCPKNCKCTPEGKIISCLDQEQCRKGETLCSDGICRKKCEVNVSLEECKYGCNFDGACLPVGVRSKGMYCGADLVVSSQNDKEESCENNFECKTNVCVDGKCISSGTLQRFFNWFKNLFGGN